MNSGQDREDNREIRSLANEKTVGELLLEARRKDGRSRAEISRITRIPEASLRYLETDNFDMLPAPVYVMGFLRNYASELGMDVDYILNKYQVHSGHDHRTKGDHWEEKEADDQPKADYTSIARKFILPLALLIVLIIIAVLVLSKGDDVEVTPPSAIPQAEEFVRNSVEWGTGDGEKQTEAGTGDRKMDQGRDNDKAPYPSEVNDSAEPMKLKLTANPSDSTWFEIITISSKDSRPDTTYHDFILFPGREKILRAEKAFVLRTIGNAGGFTAEFNGKELPVFGRQHEVARNIYLGRDSTSLRIE